MKKLNQVYEGKAKKVFETDDPDLFIQEFKDDATAFNAKKKGTIVGKGVVNNKISSVLFQMLEKEGIPTHFVKLLSEREMLVKKVKIVPLEVTIRNITAGGMAKLLGIEEGIRLKTPVYELHYKADHLDDPLINEDHALAINMATQEELDTIKKLAIKINQLLKNFFEKLNIDLVDFKLEFGRCKGKIILADEISPDTCRFWEKGTGRKLDKDRFRRDLGNVEDAYQEMLAKVVETSK
ncbi:MAG: phosphoribosylaminoimidazolesuccinocarboxamide synthase [Candidatus Omnitrophica bacterium]|nr:phosphoribosylaminoimidazolesuccinocarboxamide synthase [Candidatus Omnitrophota bacterium]